MTIARSTFGPAYSEAVDGARVERQHERIRDYMLTHDWRTLAEIAAALSEPEASVSAQLRHLRKPRFGEWSVDKRRRTDGTWEYRVRPFVPPYPPNVAERDADWPSDPKFTEGGEW